MSAPANVRLVRQGGLMRCCLATIRESTELTEPGAVLHCSYCDHAERGADCFHLMIVAEDGIWEWNHPDRRIMQ